MRLAVVAPVSPGRRIVGAEAGTDHGHGPLARLAGRRPLGRLHRFTLLCRFAADSAFRLPGDRLLLQGGLLVRNRWFFLGNSRLLLDDRWLRGRDGRLLLDDGRFVVRRGRLLLGGRGLVLRNRWFCLGGGRLLFDDGGLSSVAADFSSTAGGLSCAIAGLSSAGAAFSSTEAALSSAAGGFSSLAAAGCSCAGTEGCAAAGPGLSVADVCASACALITINNTQHSTPARSATAVDRADKRMD